PASSASYDAALAASMKYSSVPPVVAFTIARTPVRPVFRASAVGLGTNPTLCAISRILSRVDASTRPWPLSACDTVVRDTPAISAMSRIVTRDCAPAGCFFDTLRIVDYQLARAQLHPHHVVRAAGRPETGAAALFGAARRGLDESDRPDGRG